MNGTTDPTKPQKPRGRRDGSEAERVDAERAGNKKV